MSTRRLLFGEFGGHRRGQVVGLPTSLCRRRSSRIVAAGQRRCGRRPTSEGLLYQGQGRKAEFRRIVGHRICFRLRDASQESLGAGIVRTLRSETPFSTVQVESLSRLSCLVLSRSRPCLVLSCLVLSCPLLCVFSLRSVYNFCIELVT